MGVLIKGVAPNSLAASQGILPGDTLISINGHEIVDVLDYRFYMIESSLTLTVLRNDKIKFNLIKQPYDDIGLEFDTYLMDKQHSCRNKCMFCFIDQLPKGMRKSLYFKDDDSRLSFLFGNYITLTNLTEHEIKRIISMHISPVNISVHTTNPELRCQIMQNKFAGRSLAVIEQFAQAGIHMNCQLVLCPGINDGKELDRTMNDLARFIPNIECVAGVPVGLTRFRDGLPQLRTYTSEEAAIVINQMESMGEKMLSRYGNRVFCPADEFYLKAGLPLPDEDFYGDFSQLENGVGLMTLLESQFNAALEICDKIPCGSRITMATGVAAYPLIKRLAERAQHKWNNINIEVIAIINHYFGETINVAGLITGCDLIDQVMGKTGDILLIPSVMLRHEGDLFLDDVSLDDASNKLNTKIIPVLNDGEELLNAMLM